MLSPARVGASPRAVGPPRFLDRSLDARRPQPPRGARRLHLPIAFIDDAGFITSGRLAAPICVTRPNRVRLRCGSRRRRARLRQPDYSDPRSLGSVSNGQLHDEHLAVHKIGQACPGAPEYADSDAQPGRHADPDSHPDQSAQCHSYAYRDGYSVSRCHPNELAIRGHGAGRWPRGLLAARRDERHGLQGQHRPH